VDRSALNTLSTSNINNIDIRLVRVNPKAPDESVWMGKAAAIGMSRPDRDRLADPLSTAEGGMGMRSEGAIT